MSWYALDIETIPNNDMIGSMPEPDVAYGNTKDDDKRAAKLAEAIEKQRRDMALSPLYGRVCSFAIASRMSDENGDISDSIVCEVAAVDGDHVTDDTERALLKRLFDRLRSTPTHSAKLLTWNGTNFDLPFVYRRAIMLRIDLYEYGLPPLQTWVKRYQTTPHCDLQQVWSNWNTSRYERLNDVSMAILGRGKVDADFRQFPALLRTAEGRMQIKKYNTQDAVLLLDLYDRVHHYLF